MMMNISNPSFYKTIHKDTTTSRNMLEAVKQSVRRHLLKWVVCAALMALLLTSFLLLQTNASTEPAIPGANEQLIVVSSGDTIWGIAQRFTQEDDDIRFNVYKIKQRNQLATVTITPGQKLIVPKL
ncbi:LysM peptidoglycan-binding domain-containing protein [Paenibacillus gorillae]|uniref:LysM peptidoglycan-binding domain-containing protein n=1 Tax=Paenibacillus gorillae TaxID=1243662 RepID=UPI0004BC1D52|nr:LysM peptidoglycan-binding domain-containing protein [Paenibacillus gorillae]